MDTTTKETQALIAAGDNDAIGSRLIGLSKIAAEYDRLSLVAPASLINAIATLQAAFVCDGCGGAGGSIACDC